MGVAGRTRSKSVRGSRIYWRLTTPEGNPYMFGIELVVMAAMICVNSVFAAYEIALASVAVARLKRLADEKRSGAEVALYMKRNVEASLAVVQLGITLVGAVAAAVGGAGAEEVLAPALSARLGVSAAVAEVLAIGTVVVPLIVVTIIFGELIPKVYALRHAERVCLTLSPFMRWFSFSVWPAVWLFEKSVMTVMGWAERRASPGSPLKPEMAELQEIRSGAAVARAARLIGHREEGIILAATQLQTRRVRDSMLPAEHVNALDANVGLAENLIAAHLNMHTRFPVVERAGDLQSVIGYVNVKDIIATLRLSPNEPTLRAITRSVTEFRADQSLADCLESFMRERSHIATVRDGDGRVVGMITLEDVIEELVGEIEDEYDRLPVYLTPSGSAWVAGGGVSLARLKAVTGIELPADPGTATASCLSEWVEARVGRPPAGGEVIERDGVRVVVRKVRRNRVQEAQLGRNERPTPATTS